MNNITNIKNKCYGCFACYNVCPHKAIEMKENIPLYDGKTLLEKAREENMRRRNHNDARTLSEILQEPKQKRKNISWAGWWEESLASGDQTKWVMENMHLTKEQAKQKIYQKRWYQKSKAKSEPTFDEDYCNLRNDFREYKSELAELHELFKELKSSFDEVQKKLNKIINQ